MQIRKYKKRDEIQILKLDRLVETHPWNRRNLKNWQWKYKGPNPSGKSLVWVAEENKKVVATFSIIPINYYIKKTHIKGSHSIAMIVHPKWQNKGLIKFVADKLFLSAKKNNIKFIYGYPNSNAYEIHKNFFQYQDISKQQIFFSKLKKNYNLNNYNFKEKKVIRFSSEVDYLWNKIKNQQVACVERTKKFLNWRYANRPDVTYFLFKYYLNNEIIAYSVLKKYKEKNIIRGHIIDIFYDKTIENLFDFVIKKNCNFLYMKKCHEVELWLQGDSFGIDVLKKNNFRVKSKRPLIAKNIALDENFFKILNKNNWYFTMGDTLEIY